MATVTAPIMTDATGQSIDSKLNSLLGKMDNLAAAFQPNASGIAYSNTASGLTGDDVQEAIDEMAADVSEIKSSLTNLQFKAVTGHSVGTAELSLPSSWDELILQVYVQQSILTTVVLNPMVPNSYTNIGLGAYGSSWAIGQIKKDKVKILTVNWGGSDVTANASLYAFYKKY